MPPSLARRPSLAEAVGGKLAADQERRAAAVQHARTALAPYRAARPAGQPQEG